MTLQDGNSTGDQLQSVNDKLRKHHARIEARYARIETRTDAFLAATERQIAALADLKHTALWIAGALIVAGYVIVKVL